MTQVDIQVDDAFLRDVVSDLQASPSDIKRIMRTASWDTAKQTKTDVSSRVRRKVNIKKRDLDPHLSATHDKLYGARVSLKESRRLPLRDFGARDLRKSGRGVTYRIDNDGSYGGVEGRKGEKVRTSRRGNRGRVPDAFILPQYGGHVFKRRGKSRHPIQKLYAVSAWGVVVKNDMVEPIAEKAEQQLYNNTLRRVKLDIMRRTGKVKS